MEISQVLFEASTKACESLLSSFFSFHTTSIIVSCNDMADYYLYKPQAMLYLFTAILKVLLTETKASSYHDRRSEISVYTCLAWCTRICNACKIKISLFLSSFHGVWHSLLGSA